MVSCSSDLLLGSEYIEMATCPYTETLGPLVFGLFVYGTVMMGLYARTRSAVIPTVVTIFLGAVAVSQLPPGAIRILGVALILAVTIAGYYIYHQAQKV